MSSYGPPGQRREDPFIELRSPLRLLSRSSSLIFFTHPPVDRKEPELYFFLKNAPRAIYIISISIFVH
jgi:hypothetical protein